MISVRMLDACGSTWIVERATFQNGAVQITTDRPVRVEVSEADRDRLDQESAGGSVGGRRRAVPADQARGDGSKLTGEGGPLQQLTMPVLGPALDDQSPATSAATGAALSVWAAETPVSGAGPGSCSPTSAPSRSAFRSTPPARSSRTRGQNHLKPEQRRNRL